MDKSADWHHNVFQGHCREHFLQDVLWRKVKRIDSDYDRGFGGTDGAVGPLGDQTAAAETGRCKNWTAYCNSFRSQVHPVIAPRILPGTYLLPLERQSVGIHPRCVDYRCAIIDLPACGHNSGQRWLASNVSLAKCLERLTAFVHKREGAVTVLAHGFSIRSGQLGSKRANTIVQFLYLRFSKYGAWGLVLKAVDESRE